jgi:hypothetical protein
MRLRYARWQGFVAVAAMLAFIVATKWHYKALGIGVGLAVIVLLRGGEWLVKRFANRNARPS